MKVYILLNILDATIKSVYKTEELAKYHKDLMNSQSSESPFAYYEEHDVIES